jgi:hypothetical protein
MCSCRNLLHDGYTEEDLYELFSKYGELNSIKVMWPRTEEEKARKRNCGFVSFMRRADAEDAKYALQEYEMEGARMSICWGKAVKLNSCPFVLPSNIKSVPAPVLPPVLPPLMPTHSTSTCTSSSNKTSGPADVSALLAMKAPSMAPPVPSGPPPPPTPPPLHQQQSLPAASATVGGTVKSNRWDAKPEDAFGSGGGAGGSGAQQQIMKPGDPRIEIVVPTSRRVRHVIDTLAKFVAADGEAFEKVQLAVL